MKITTNHLKQVVQILNLVRGSTVLMELINTVDLLNMFTITNVEDLLGMVESPRAYLIAKIFSRPEILGNILNNSKEVSEELALEYTLSAIYTGLKIYEETSLGENNNEN